MTDTPHSAERALLEDDLNVILQFSSLLSKASYELEVLNRQKGWYDKPLSIGDLAALLHDEVSEFFEAYRDLGPDFVALPYKEDEKPEGAMYELADVILRAMDTANRLRELDPENTISLGLALLRKYRYNRHRPYRHGNKPL